MDRLFLTRVDRSNESTTTSLHVPDMSAANFDAHQASAASIEAAVAAITQADAHKIGYTQMVNEQAKNGAGFREVKWLVRYRDNTNFKEFTFEIGTSDPAAPTIVETSGKEILDPASTEYANLASEINSFCLSPYGNGISVYEVELVGRRT